MQMVPYVIELEPIMKIAVFGTHKFEKPFLVEANAEKHELHFFETRMHTKTAVLANNFDCIVAFVNDELNAAVLELLAEAGVKYIALRSAGYNHIDLEKAAELGFRVARVPEYSPYAIAEHTVGLMLALNRKLIRANSRVKELNFSLDGLVGFDMHQKVVGIVGMGKIGKVISKILKGFGCKVIVYDPGLSKEEAVAAGVVKIEFDRLCYLSDIITLHCPLTPETHYMIGRKEIATMKKGVMLINTSRGGLVDTKEVIRGLKTGQIGYLGLDVYEEEKGLFFEDQSDKILQDDVIARLMTFPNVLITSHQAFLTQTALKNIAETTFQNINHWDNGEASPYEIV